MKECDYCGRENADDVVFCRECGTDRFKNWPARLTADEPRLGVIDCIKNWATVLDELASCKEVLISWMMAAWITLVWVRLMRPDFAPASLYVGLRAGWFQNVALPLMLGATFLLAPIIGSYNIVRWLRQGKQRTLLNLMAWVLLAFFVGVFCFVWVGWWNANRRGMV